MRAALEARRDPRLVIAGRTSAAAITGLPDAIARAEAYQAAGVDAIFLVGVKTRADLEAIGARIELPLILGGAGKELRDLDWLAQQRVRVCLQGHQPFMAGVQAIYRTLHALREGTPPERLEGVADDALMKQLMRDEDYARWSKDWL
jgi:carboxyvinyl-carboxyphosphonate phosphorylmutase